MKIISFGEVLWDNLPSCKKLGGAPLNVLVRLRALGADCAIISSRGADADGDEIQRQIEEKGYAKPFEADQRTVTSAAVVIDAAKREATL